MAMLVSLVGMYIVVFLLGKILFRHTVGGAALQAIAVSFTAGPFFGPAVLIPIYGTSSAVAISMIALILNIVIVPATLVQRRRLAPNGATVRTHRYSAGDTIQNL
jgi:malonate transporter and related proteins